MKIISLILFLSCTLIAYSYGAVSDTYQEDDISVSFKRAYLNKSFLYSSEFCIELKLKVIAKDKIIRPRTNYRSEYVKLHLSDNFGNDLGFRSTSPTYYGKNTEIGLRPGEEKIFTLGFSNKPLESADYLLLKVPEKVFGNINPFELKISNPVIEPLATKAKTLKQIAEELDKRERELVESLRRDGVDTNDPLSSLSSTGKEEDEARQKEIEKGGTAKKIYLGIFLSLSALCSLGLIYFLWRKTAKKTILYCKSFFLLLPQWAKQNRLHFSILKIFSALICLGWLIFSTIMRIRIGSINNIFKVTLYLGFAILLSIASLWIIYFAVYGIIRLICYIAKNRATILWFGMIAFIAWCVFAVVLDLYLRQFTPVALAISVFTAVLIYTTKKISPANKQKD